ATVLLQRKGKLGKVISSEAEPQLIEGSWKDDDIFILMSEQALDFIDEIQQKMSQGYDEETVVASLVPNVHAHEQSSLQAVAFVTKKEVAAPAEPEAAAEDEPESESEPGFAIEIEVAEPEPEAEREIKSEGGSLPVAVIPPEPKPTFRERVQPGV